MTSKVERLISESEQRLTSTSSYPVLDLGTYTCLDLSSLPLKPDHASRPFWVAPTGLILLEASSPLYEEARDFLVAIAEPLRRPNGIHEYRLDKEALFAAASMDMTGADIVGALERFSKVPLARSVVDFVHACTMGYGKAKLVTRRARYFVESRCPLVLRLLARHPAIRAAIVSRRGGAAAAAAAAVDGTATAGAEDVESLLLTRTEDAGGGGGGAAEAGFGAGTAARAAEARATAAAVAAASDPTGALAQPRGGEPRDGRWGEEEEEAEVEDEESGGGVQKRAPPLPWGELPDETLEEMLDALEASMAALQQAGGEGGAEGGVVAAVTAGGGGAAALAASSAAAQEVASATGTAVAAAAAPPPPAPRLKLKLGGGGKPPAPAPATAPAPTPPAARATAAAAIMADEGDSGSGSDYEATSSGGSDDSERGFVRRGRGRGRGGRGDGVRGGVRGGAKRGRSAGGGRGEVGGKRGGVGGARDGAPEDPALAAFRRFADALPPAALFAPGAEGRVEYFEVEKDAIDTVRQVAMNLSPPVPLLQEYDHHAEDPSSPDAVAMLLDGRGVGARRVVLRDPAAMRKYQTMCMEKMFSNKRARSGVVVLPCGAGKTLVGIAAAVTIGKSAMVLCPNVTSVKQWEEQFLRFTTLPRASLVRLTSKDKGELPPRSEGCVMITTYSMIGAGGKSAVSRGRLEAIRGRAWGLQVLDEVHQAVASKFSRALKLPCHCRLGLTATLVREDEKQRDLSHKLGPKLYEANWKDLTVQGFLANVQCIEVRCPMEPRFYEAYLEQTRARGAGELCKSLAVMNPVKAWAMDFLLNMHLARGDKVIVFSDSIFALSLYADFYGKMILTGQTKEIERDVFLESFRAPGSSVLFLSRVGDVALDVPDANVIIQLSSHFGSRLQEAQRMGRILRRSAEKGRSKSSFFYSLVSQDTLEVHYGMKRRRYLVDQGYAYKVLQVPGGFDSPEVRVRDMAELRALAARGGEVGPDGAQKPGARELTKDEGIRKVLASLLSQREEINAKARAEAAGMAELLDGGADEEEEEEEGGRGGGAPALAPAGGWAAGGEEEGGGGGGGAPQRQPAAAAFSRRALGGTLSSLSGAAGLRFLEFESGAGKEAEAAAEDEGRKEATATTAGTAAGRGLKLSGNSTL
jgi:DNA repair helicase Rad25